MVKCEACDSDTTSYYEVKGKKLCLSCYTDISQDKSQIKKENVLKSITEEYSPHIDNSHIVNKEKIKIKPQRTNLGILLRVCSVISLIICLLAGIAMFSIRVQGETTIMLAFYNSFGLFAIGLSFFIFALLWGLANLVEKN